MTIIDFMDFEIAAHKGCCGIVEKNPDEVYLEKKNQEHYTESVELTLEPDVAEALNEMAAAFAKEGCSFNDLMSLILEALINVYSIDELKKMAENQKT